MEGLLWFVIFGGLFYVMMRYGCGAHMVHGHGEHAGHAAHGSDEGESIDPVCGMTVAVDQGYGKMLHGTFYRFCSRNCLDRFEADPEKYTLPAGGAGGAS